MKLFFSVIMYVVFDISAICKKNQLCDCSREDRSH